MAEKTYQAAAFQRKKSLGVGAITKSILSKLQTDQQLDCALDLMRRLPPQQIEKNLSDLIDLVPDLCEDLLSSIDQPLKVAVDKLGKEYLLCDYNRDGDSYRYCLLYCKRVGSVLGSQPHCYRYNLFQIG